MTLFGGSVGSLTAIDMHVHLEPEEDNRIDSAAKKYFGDSGAARDRRGMAEYYRSRKIGFVVFSVDEKLTGKPRVSWDEGGEFAAANADIAVPVASGEPIRGCEGGAAAQRLVSGGAVRGLKLHPPVQQFFPDERIAYPLYEVFAEARLPVLFHTGHSGIGTGLPGGGGVRLKYGNPLPIDDVAVDFPDMPQLVQYANTLLKNKVLFGSDYPLITPDRWLADLEKTAIRDEVRPLILKENARKLLGIA